MVRWSELVQTRRKDRCIGGDRLNELNELKRNYENFKMALVGSMNLGLETLDRMMSRAMAENQAKEKRIQELEAKIKELEKK
jgi:hypothetical protein